MMKEPMSEEKREALLMSEDDILSGMLAAANFKTDESYRKTIHIVRPVEVVDEATGEKKTEKKTMFQFTIRPLDAAEVQQVAKDATKKDGEGNNVFDSARNKSGLIYTATVGEKGKKLWDNKTIKSKLNTLDALDVINEVLLVGEKETIYEIISEISGFSDNREEMLKNS